MTNNKVVIQKNVKPMVKAAIDSQPTVQTQPSSSKSPMPGPPKAKRWPYRNAQGQQ